MIQTMFVKTHIILILAVYASPDFGDSKGAIHLHNENIIKLKFYLYAV